MKLKYYLRGLGIGMMVTAIVLTLSFTSRRSGNPTDSEIRQKAKDLGMTDAKETLITNSDKDLSPEDETEDPSHASE